MTSMNYMKEAKLTIVMPAYNASKYISTTISAIVAQTFTDWALLIINDCSTDNTKQIVEKWCQADQRIRLVNNPENLKVARSMNKGIELVDTPFFTRIDSDDEPLPQHFESLVGYLERHIDIAICGSQVITIDENGAFKRKWNYETDSEWLKVSSIFACPFLQSAVIMRTEVIKALGGYRLEKELVEDYDLWIRALQQYKSANHDGYTMQYRIHNTNMSETNKDRIMSLLSQLYSENKDNYPIDTTCLSLHARIEFGDWSLLNEDEMNALGAWRKNLIKINQEKGFYSNALYNDVLKKYFTNMYLKIATQNTGILRYKALYTAFMVSPKWLLFITKRKRENSKLY